MKKNNVLARDCFRQTLLACALLLGVSSATPLCAQERGDWSMTVGADVASNYLWRGMNLAGPSLQPSAYFDYEKDDWAVSMGVWASKTLLNNEYDELDFSLEATWRNFTLTLLDYGDDYSVPWQKGHFLDLGLSYTLSEDIPVTFSWYSIINQTFEGSMDGGGFDWQAAFPSYFEVAYDFSLWKVDFSAASGLLPFASGYYENDVFGVCNLSLKAGHEFEFDHGGTLPISAQVMYNPMNNAWFGGVSVGYYFSLDF